MKCLLILFLLILSSGEVYSQETKFQSKDSIVYRNSKFTCESGASQAYRDFSDGKYNLYSYGLIVSFDYEFDKFYEEYAKEKYDIIIKDMGCVITPYSECYTKTMDSLVYRKFGRNIEKKMSKEARKIYNKL